MTYLIGIFNFYSSILCNDVYFTFSFLIPYIFVLHYGDLFVFLYVMDIILLDCRESEISLRIFCVEEKYQYQKARTNRTFFSEWRIKISNEPAVWLNQWRYRYEITASIRTTILKISHIPKQIQYCTVSPYRSLTLMSYIRAYRETMFNNYLHIDES